MLPVWRPEVLLKRTRSFSIRSFFYLDDMYSRCLLHPHSVRELPSILSWSDTHLSYDFPVPNWLSDIAQPLRAYVSFEDMKICISKVNL